MTAAGIGGRAMTTDAAATLLADAAELLRAVRRQAGPAGNRPLAELEQRARRPLQVAVGGPVSAGKSTLINALLGCRLAPVRPGETAQVTTVYRQAPPGSPPRAWLITTGGRHHVPLEDDGRIPVLPAGPEVLRVEAEVDADALTGLDLVDTPGLYSADEAGPSARGRRALLGRDSEVIVFVLAETPSAKEAGTLTVLRSRLPEMMRGCGLLAVLNKADRYGGPFSGATAMVAAARTQLGPEPPEVVAVSARLAEAALPTGLDDRSLDLLEKLAAARPNAPSGLNSVLVRALSGATVAEAERLIRALGPDGVGVAVERLVAGCDRAGLRRDLRARSGVPRLVEVMRTRFLGRATLLKAVRLLADLQDLLVDPAFGAPGVRGALAARAEGLLGRPVLDDLRAWQAVDGLGAPHGLGPVSRRDAVRLLSAATPAGRLGLPDRSPVAERRRRLAAEQRRWATVAARGQALDRTEAELVGAVRRTLATLLHDLDDLDEGKPA